MLNCIFSLISPKAYISIPKVFCFPLQLSVRIPCFQWMQQDFSLFAFDLDIFLCFPKTTGNRAENPKSLFSVFTRFFGVKHVCKAQLSFVLWHMPSLKQRIQLRLSRWSQADASLWFRWIGEIAKGKSELQNSMHKPKPHFHGFWS